MRISFWIILSSVLILSSCSQGIKKKVGLVDSGPNEYAVTKNKPLEIPPHFDVEEIERSQAKEPGRISESSAK